MKYLSLIMLAFLSLSAGAQKSKSEKDLVAIKKPSPLPQYATGKKETPEPGKTGLRMPGTKNDFTRRRTIPLTDENALDSYELEISTDKTTHLIFPQPIKYVDVSTADVLVDKADVIDNVLRMKAVKENFSEATITVITGDGQYFSFLANYNPSPRLLSITFNKNNPGYRPAAKEAVMSAKSSEIIFEKSTMSEGEMSQYAEYIIKHKRTVKHLAQVAYDFRFSADGLFIKDNVFFLKLGFGNNAYIDYDIDFVKFFIKDKEVAKRTPQQDIEVKPIYIFNSGTGADKIKGKTKTFRVYSFDKFTIPGDKQLWCQVYEVNGGRKLEFAISNEDIIRAKIPEKLTPEK